MLYFPTLIRYSNWVTDCPNTSSVDRNMPFVPYALNVRDAKIDLIHHGPVFQKGRVPGIWIMPEKG
jgi:hypothetical protein